MSRKSGPRSMKLSCYQIVSYDSISIPNREGQLSNLHTPWHMIGQGLAMECVGMT